MVESKVKLHSDYMPQASSNDLPFQVASILRWRPLDHLNGGQGVDLELEEFLPWETIGHCRGTDHLGPVQKQLFFQEEC